MTSGKHTDRVHHVHGRLHGHRHAGGREWSEQGRPIVELAGVSSGYRQTLGIAGVNLKLWPAQFLVVGLYVLLFRREIVTRRDMDRFREIVARHAPPGGSARRSPDPRGTGEVRHRLPGRKLPSPGLAAGPIDHGRGWPPPAG